MTAIPHPAGEVSGRLTAGSAAYEAYRILQIAFVVAPILAGADKFFGKLTNWDMYVAPSFAKMFGEGNVHSFMMLAGVVEIIAGIGVALKPRFFSWVVAAWLLCIIINLVACGQFYDIALRDVGLCLG